MAVEPRSSRAAAAATKSGICSGVVGQVHDFLEAMRPGLTQQFDDLVKLSRHRASLRCLVGRHVRAS